MIYFQSEYCQIIHQNCLDYMASLKEDTFDLIITSPPYNLGATTTGLSSRYGDYDDNLSMEKYYEFQKQAIQNMIRVTKREVFYNIQMLSSNKLALFKLIGDYADKIKEVFIWDKGFGTPAINSNTANSNFEFIFVFSKYDANFRKFNKCNFQQGEFSNVIRVGRLSNNKYRNVNSAAFPISIPSIIIRNFAQPDDYIYGPFLGTGTTLEVCEVLKIKAVGTDISKDCCEVAKKKLINRIEGRLI